MQTFLFSFLLLFTGSQPLEAAVSHSNTVVAPPKTERVQIQTSAVCGMCEKTIKQSLMKVKGVKEAQLNMDTKVVTVVYQPKFTNPDALRTAISKVGYDADQVPADPAAYEKLHACCKKDAVH